MEEARSVEMLTKLKVRGFKNLHGLEVEFGPFTCIAGENAAGKSNLFDAVDFLSLLADHPLMDAAQRVRGIGTGRAGDPRDLFWDGYGRQVPHPIGFEAEMIVPGSVEDDFGQQAPATITFLRYRIELGYGPPTGRTKIGRLGLLSESLEHINLGDAPAHLRFPLSVKRWRSVLLHGRRSGVAFISTEHSGDDTLIKIHQDGGSRGQPRIAAAANSPATVVSTTTQSSDPTVLAARREMQSWRRLALMPSSLRAPDSYSDPSTMEADGRHLAATLYRVASGEDTKPEDVYATVASRLAALTGVDVASVRVDADDARETLTLLLRERSGVELPARSLSEGTLRFLALCVLLEDPQVTGLFCLEEPENGIHPANVPAMVDLVRDLALDAFEEPGRDNPMRQVIVNTHSPAVVQLMAPDDLLFADVAPRSAGDASSPRGALRLRPMLRTWRDPEGRRGVGKADLITYLSEPPGAQLTLRPLTDVGAA